MRISSVRIENFRSIKALTISLSDTTVFIGPNNAGKSAILDAIRIALTRRWGTRGTGFTEYDIHLGSETDDPKSSFGIVIEIRAEESVPDEWPDAVHQALMDIIQGDPVTGRASVTLRVTNAWSVSAGAYEPGWTFLNAARQPLVGGSARRVNLERFWQYIPVFYLGALRDAHDEFSTRSQFWGRLLRAMQIPQDLEARVQRVLDLLNRKLLRADPRLEQIASTLSRATRIAARDRDGAAELRLMPLKSWDLLSKAEIILRNEPSWPWLPLAHHGQGIQSLSVIFLFQAFVEHLLADLYEAESTPVLALEEPETHLHPQAARTLWNHVSAVPGQKLITTHSPYFVQHVPFRDLRLVRLTGQGTEVKSLPSSFSAKIPYVDGINDVVTRHGNLLSYDRASETLTVAGSLEEPIYRQLLTAYGTHPDRAVATGVLRALRDESRLYMSDDELRALETYARRIRGEIFFARRWFIVEGQAEYLIVHALARAVGYDLDEHGVAVIDAANNGNPSTFVALARALGIPWIAVFDGDAAGSGYVRAIVAKGFDQALMTERCATLPAGTLEQQLMRDGLEPELKVILQRIGVDSSDMDTDAVLHALDDNKTRYAAELAVQMTVTPELGLRMPACFRDAIAKLRGLE
jgi:putative ATP-dependent endonuclease of the OLD family